MGILETLVTYLSYSFVVNALVVGTLIALCSSLLGTTLVMKRLSFIGDGLSHVAFGAYAVAAVANITNIQAGHHQFDRGIKTAEVLEALYNGGELEENGITDRVLTININGTYNLKSENHPNIYEATRKSWKLSPVRARKVDYVLSEYRGVVRAIFVPEKWSHEKDNDKRWMFEGYEITEENNPEVYRRYINKHLPKVKGTQNPLHYYNV